MCDCVCVRARVCAFVVSAQAELTRSRTPGHDSQDNLSKSEGESVASDAHEAPGAATGKGVTAAPAAAAAGGGGGAAAAAAPESTIENPVKEAEKLPEIGEAGHKDSLQEAVDKAQASKTGVISSLDGGDKEGAGMFEAIFFFFFGVKIS